MSDFGEETQKRLASATIAIVGCGALGTWQAELLARMGVGALRIADSDVVSLDNLHRQILFSERDAEEGLPKVAAAATRLAALNSSVAVHPFAERITHANISAFVGDASLVLDATDHVATRFLINDFCVRKGLPWIYTGVVGEEGLVFPIVPPAGPCLRCLYPEPPAETDLASCVVGGILPTTVALAVSLQVTQALRILNGSVVPGMLIRLNAWAPTVRTSAVRRVPGCPCCGGRRFDFLDNLSAEDFSLATLVCSQKMVRVEARFWGSAFDAARALAEAASRGALVEHKGLLWNLTQNTRRISLFPDGHMLVHDCMVPEEALAAARALFSEV